MLVSIPFLGESGNRSLLIQSIKLIAAKHSLTQMAIPGFDLIRARQIGSKFEQAVLNTVFHLSDSTYQRFP